MIAVVIAFVVEEGLATQAGALVYYRAESMRKFVPVLVFLVLIAELKGTLYEGKWSTPLEVLGTILLEPLLKFPTIYIIAGVVAFLNRDKISKNQARPIPRFIRVTLLTTLGLWVWGVVTGGNAYQTIWQLHGFIAMFVFAFMLMATMTTPADFRAIGKAIVFAGMFRAGMAFIFFFYVLKTLNISVGDIGSGFCVTTHNDTTLFVTGIVIMIAWALETRTWKAALKTFAVFMWLAVAIQINNRRLAWVSLIASFAILYAMLPKGRIRRSINKAGMVMVPVIAMYVAVGWGRTEGIFKPVGSLSTMFGKKEDASSETRNIENYNLIQTLKPNPVLGTGWGHEYNEVSVAYSIKEIFPQYRFIPHNSVLGLLAFTGYLGFAGTWMIFPVVVYLASRTLKVATGPVERVACVVAIAEVAIFTNQGYGDMGLSATTCTMIMACGMAAVGRFAKTTGAWPSGAPSLPAPEAPPAEVAALPEVATPASDSPAGSPADLSAKSSKETTEQEG